MHSIVLLKNLFLSTSTFNQLKYEKDKKRHGKIVAGQVGRIVLYAMGLFFCVMLSIGFGAWGFASSIPSACAIIITFMEFFFCLLKTNGYLFARSGYDMIMSLPFSVKTVVSSRFLYMYIKNLPWVLLISCSMMIGYGIFAKPLFIVYIIWILFTLLLPMIPMVLAAFIGAGIAAVSSGFRHKNMKETIVCRVLTGPTGSGKSDLAMLLAKENGWDSEEEQKFLSDLYDAHKTEEDPTKKKKLGDIPIIAEDLGTLTPVTEKLLEDAGYPGMKVLQYAFDWTEYSYYLPYNHIKNCVVYTGTHDNTTTRAWIEEISDHDRDLARRYIHSENTDYGTFVWDMIREAYRSVADLCIIPMQDYLVKGKEARINHPGTLGENWKWRLQPNFLSKDLSNSIYKLAKLYGRIPKADEKEKKA